MKKVIEFWEDVEDSVDKCDKVKGKYFFRLFKCLKIE